jgi:hypothetical protein
MLGLVVKFSTWDVVVLALSGDGQSDCIGEQYDTVEYA